MSLLRQRVVRLETCGLLGLSGLCGLSGLAGCEGDTLHLGVREAFIVSHDHDVVVAQGDISTELEFEIAPSRAVDSLSWTDVPGVTIELKTPHTLELSAAHDTPPGTYDDFTIFAHIGGRTIETTVPITVAVVAAVQPAIDNTQGNGGKIRQYLSTSFQPADWQFRFFERHPDTTRLEALRPTHVLVQIMNGGAIPWKKSSTTQAADDWDFSKLDAIVGPLLKIGDKSPELQIAVAPRIGNMVDSSGNFRFNEDNLKQFRTYCENLVRYYNTDGFDWGGRHFQSPAPRQPVRWWGILSDVNVRRMTQEDYVVVYKSVTEGMTSVDPSVRFSALELSDSASPFPGTWFEYFGTQVSERVDAIAWHIYGTVRRDTKDQDVFDRIATSRENLRAIRGSLGNLADKPIRVTQNNVNGDAPDSDGNSAADPKTRFQEDERGTSTFFAAYRPYLYSQLAKAGGQALYHWQHTAGTCEVGDGGFCTKSDSGLDTSRQNSEVDYVTGQPYISYWVDYWLNRMFPFTDESTGDDLLQIETSDENADVEILATRRTDGSVTVMLVDHAVAVRDDTESRAADRNGAGLRRDVVVDMSAFAGGHPFSSVSVVTIDKNSRLESLGLEPVATPLDTTQRTVISLAGYGVAFAVFRP